MSSGGTLQLSYAFVPDPNPIRASVDGENPNQINLLVMISNPNAPDVVTLQGIAIQIPVGGDLGGDLSAAENLPAPAPATSGPWVISSSGDTISIQPQTGTTATLADTITFTLKNITVNKEKGSVQLKITEVDQNGNSTTDTSQKLVKQAPDFPVTSFKASPNMLYDLEQKVTLTWTCSSQGQQYTYRVYSVDPESPVQPGPKSWRPKECLNSGDCYTCASGGHGVTTPPQSPPDYTLTITFCLDVIETLPGGSRSIIETLTTTVGVELPSLSPQSSQTHYPHLSGRLVVLDWLAFNAGKCTLELDGSVIEEDVPLNTYRQGYPLFLTIDPGPTGQTHTLTLNAYAKVGTAKVFINFPPFVITNPIVSIPIPFGLEALAIASSANNPLALMSNSFNNTVMVIDILQGEAEANPINNVGMIPTVIATTPDGTLALVVNLGDNTVSVIDIATRTAEAATIPVSDGRGGIVVTPDGSLALVVNPGGNNLSVIDIAKRQKEPQPIPADSPGPIALTTSNGKLLAVIGCEPGLITIIDMATRQPVPNSLHVGTASGFIATTPDGTLAFVVDIGKNNMIVINMDTLTAEPDAIPLSNRPNGIVITPDGALALVVYGRNEVTVVNIATRTGRNIPIPGGQSAYLIALTADGSRAVMQVYENALVI